MFGFRISITGESPPVAEDVERSTADLKHLVRGVVEHLRSNGFTVDAFTLNSQDIGADPTFEPAPAPAESLPVAEIEPTVTESDPARSE